MIKPFSETDLIRYIYGETSTKEDDQIEQAVIDNPDLKESLSFFIGGATTLDLLLLHPSENSMGKILEYSINYSQKHK